RLNEINVSSNTGQILSINRWSKALLTLSVASSLPKSTVEFHNSSLARASILLNQDLKNPSGPLPAETATQLADAVLERVSPYFLSLSSSTLEIKFIGDFSSKTPTLSNLTAPVAKVLTAANALQNNVTTRKMLNPAVHPTDGLEILGLVEPAFSVGHLGELQRMIDYVEKASLSSSKLANAKKVRDEVVVEFSGSKPQTAETQKQLVWKVRTVQLALLTEQLTTLYSALKSAERNLESIKERLGAALRNSQNTSPRYKEAQKNYNLARANYDSVKGLYGLLGRDDYSTKGFPISPFALIKSVANASGQLKTTDSFAGIAVASLDKLPKIRPAPAGTGAVAEKGKGVGTATQIPGPQVVLEKPRPGQRLYDLNEKPPATWEDDDVLSRTGKRPTIFRYVPWLQETKAVTIHGTVGAPQYTTITDPIEYEVNGKKMVHVTVSGFDLQFNFSRSPSKPDGVPGTISFNELRRTTRSMVSDKGKNPKYVYEDRSFTGPRDYKATFIFIKYRTYTNEKGDRVSEYSVYNPKHYLKEVGAPKFIGSIKSDPKTGELGIYADVKGSSVYVCPVTKGDRGGYKPVITNRNFGAVIGFFGVSGSTFGISGVPLDSSELYPTVVPIQKITPK
ncbi:MAG: hypothetical protein ABID61_05450, partial [Candidatus Micrarchaeota archaeon]